MDTAEKPIFYGAVLLSIKEMIMTVLESKQLGWTGIGSDFILLAGGKQVFSLIKTLFRCLVIFHLMPQQICSANDSLGWITCRLNQFLWYIIC